MRTTIRIDDDLYRTVKAKAARAGRTVAEVIEDAVRASLADRPASDAPPLTTFGRRGPLPGVDLADTARLLDTMDDEAGTLDARR